MINDLLAEQAEQDAKKAEAIAIISLALGAVTLINQINQPKSVNGAQGAPGVQGPQGIQGLPGAPGANGTNGTNGTNGAAGPGTPFTTIYNGTVVTSAADFYLSTQFATAATINSNASTRVFAPTGSTWRARVGYDGTIAAGEVLSCTIRTSTTFNGVFVDTAAVASANNGDGANPNKISGTLTMLSDQWLTVVARYTNVVALGQESLISLERLT